MKLDEADETLETQEELFRFEREKFKTLEKDLARKGRKTGRL